MMMMVMIVMMIVMMMMTGHGCAPTKTLVVIKMMRTLAGGEKLNSKIL